MSYCSQYGSLSDAVNPMDNNMVMKSHFWNVEMAPQQLFATFYLHSHYSDAIYSAFQIS